MTSPPPKVETQEPQPQEIPPFPYNPAITLGGRPASSTPAITTSINAPLQSTANLHVASNPTTAPNSELEANASIEIADATTADHTNDIAYRSSSARRRHGPDSSLRDLQALPEVRSIPWIPGRELPPDKSTESPRAQTRGAFMLSTRGKIRDPPCNHCTSGSGRFSVCVSLDSWFFGACATCQMATRGHLCSLRTAANGSPIPRAPRQQVFKVLDPTPTPPPQDRPISTQQYQAPPNTNSLKRKADEPMMPGMRVLQPRGDNYPLIAPAPQNATQSHIQPQPQQNSGYTPINSRPNTSSPGYFSERPLNNNITNTASTNTYQSQPQPQPQAQASNGIAMSSWNNINASNINTSTSRQDPTPYPQKMSKPSPDLKSPTNLNGNPSNSNNPYTHSPTLTKNPPNPHPNYPSQNISYPPQNSNPPHLQNPSTQSQSQPQPQPPPQPEPSQPQSSRSRTLTSPETSLIDSIPRKKQKQIFGIIGGLQSGIRSVRQQAENLQRQLDILQSALGIDSEDETEEGAS
ncbi:hypothetical protein HYFRA_00007632 [Hymenoscyphus fraxineus]|uniref:Uncharacterized protein n=1 Tax=Hymenoscyphus fraxineus TaxID=746836 RepID=A0A9N9KUK0_9HELO|nr:hypothetical protein HYFRA_00007632 [Hymenoscyphus fraxineus]